MLRRIVRAKIHRAAVTESRLDYEGSIQVDEALLEAAGILEHELVQVANISNGERFETYVIKGPRNSGAVGLRGAAARLGAPGDLIIIFSVALMEEEEAKKLKVRFVYVDDKNRVTQAH